MEKKIWRVEREVFAEWVGVEYTVARLTSKDNICRPHLTCTNTHPHREDKILQSNSGRLLID